ncbi:hypothetical protein NC652_001348 [Populus alba x Populus x berolinensis]|nr:hypothetical protein NC652_001348 [Populus alba x Populus x berolinensis]
MRNSRASRTTMKWQTLAYSKEKGEGRGELQRNQQPAITSMFLKHLTLNNMHGDRHFQLGNNSLEHYKNVVPRRPLSSPSCHLCMEQATLVLSPIISKFISYQNCASPALHVCLPLRILTLPRNE